MGLAFGLFSLLGKEILIGSVGVPRGLPDSPDEAFDLASWDGDRHASVWAERSRGARSAEAKHAMVEPHEPRMLARLVPPRALRTAGDDDLQLDKSFVTFIDGADPGDCEEIIAGHTRGVDHAAHSA